MDTRRIFNIVSIFVLRFQTGLYFQSFGNEAWKVFSLRTFQYATIWKFDYVCNNYVQNKSDMLVDVLLIWRDLLDLNIWNAYPL